MRKALLFAVLITTLIYISMSYSHLGIGVEEKSIEILPQSSEESVIQLLFPLRGYAPYDTQIRNVFDHSTHGAPYFSSRKVIAYTGEYGDLNGQKQGCGCYKQSGIGSFSLNGNYIGASDCGGSDYLCYDGYPGTDYSVPENTPVLAAANGIVHIPDIFPGLYNAQAYNTIEIEHMGGYRTYYLHLNKQLVAEGQCVVKGQLIGLSGNVGTTAYYLHFEVQKNGVPVDPYGWEGEGADPYLDAVNHNLWELKSSIYMVASSSKSQDKHNSYSVKYD